MIKIKFVLIGELVLKLNIKEQTVVLEKEEATVGEALAELAAKNPTLLSPNYYKSFQLYLEKDDARAVNINSLQKLSTQLGENNRIIFLYPLGGG